MKGRRLLALAAPLLAVAAGAASFAYFVPDYSQRVAATANVAPPKSAYTLRAGDEFDPAALDGMDRSLAVSGLRAVLNDWTGLRGRWGGTCGGARIPPGATIFCFNAADSRTTEWDPQGITSNAQQQVPERPLLVSWYDEDQKEPDRSARVTFVNTRNGTYRHVLLVLPYRNAQGRTDYEPVGVHSTDTGVHAGGLAWYGNRLYLADAGNGLRVFDMRRIFDLGKSQNGSTTRRDLVGLHRSTYHAYGYRYVMPQVYSYAPAKQTGEACTTDGTPHHSWLSINRSKESDSLVTGEWCKNDHGRVAQYPLADSGGLATDTKGQAVPSWVARLPASSIQGGATANDEWWFTRNSSGAGELLQADWADVFKNVRHQAIAPGPEDLTCQRGSQRLWTIAENPGRRAIYGLPQPDC